jgi:hypothetical protein
MHLSSHLGTRRAFSEHDGILDGCSHLVIPNEEFAEGDHNRDHLTPRRPQISASRKDGTRLLARCGDRNVEGSPLWFTSSDILQVAGSIHDAMVPSTERVVA